MSGKARGELLCGSNTGLTGFGNPDASGNWTGFERDKWTPPPRDLHPGSTVWIKAARHPLLNPATVVPTNLTLDEDVFVVLITGPNTRYRRHS